MSDFSGLSIEGRLATPGDTAWDAARAAWNLAVDQHPRAVAFVESTDDLARVVRHAGEHGLSVTAQGTGHGASSLGPLEDTILVKTERMRRVEVDAQARTARVEAGVLAVELGAAAQPHGLCPLPGSSTDVGRGRLLQLRRAPLRPRRDPPRRDLRAAARDQGPLGPRRRHPLQPRALDRRGLSAVKRSTLHLHRPYPPPAARSDRADVAAAWAPTSSSRPSTPSARGRAAL
jgi:FAD binding domain